MQRRRYQGVIRLAHREQGGRPSGMSVRWHQGGSVWASQTPSASHGTTPRWQIIIDPSNSEAARPSTGTSPPPLSLSDANLP